MKETNKPMETGKEMKKEEKEIKMICDKCGKEMPVDKENSNENWIAYKPKCPCGGKLTIDLNPTQ